MNWFPRVVPGGHVLLHDSYFGSDVQAAAVEFMQEMDLQIVVSPFVVPFHWHYPTGSIAHFIKKV